MNIKDKLANLIDVKTITTFVVLLVFAVLALTNKISNEDVMRVTLIIITFFFAKKSSEKEM